MPHPTSCIRFRSVFPKKAWIILHKTDPDPIWMAWSGFWPNVCGLETSRCVGIIWPGFWQDATGPLSVSHFKTRFRSSRHPEQYCVQNQPRSGLVLADCVRFWPNGSGPEVSWCARVIRPDPGQCFRADPDRVRNRSGMFTGLPYFQHDVFVWTLSYTT